MIRDLEYRSKQIKMRIRCSIQQDMIIIQFDCLIIVLLTTNKRRLILHVLCSSLANSCFCLSPYIAKTIYYC